MNIIVEGPDGAGKSTLCQFLSTRLGRLVIGGEGPSRHIGDFDLRISRLLRCQEVIFDRHPAVSGPLYNKFREGPQDWPSVESLRDFYSSSPIFLYCHPTEATQHNADNAAVDTPEYLEWLTKNELGIRQEYERWALHHSHLTYRAGDDPYLILRALKGMIHGQ
jgi:hypothetical protein